MLQRLQNNGLPMDQNMRMMQKEETNLGIVIFKVEVGTREPGLDDIPEPVHW